MTDSQTEVDQQPYFYIEKYYLKGSSFESPNAPEIFRDADWKPKINLDVNSHTTKLHEHVHEVVLQLTVTAKNEDKNIYLVEVQQAGIYTLRNFEPDRLHEVLGSFCPGLLYPWAAQTITDLVMKGGFPQLNLAPINFDAIYRESLQRQQQEAGVAE